ncbi:CxxxxCH/CxxCH domain-containing protein [Shinella sp. DD12]
MSCTALLCHSSAEKSRSFRELLYWVLALATTRPLWSVRTRSVYTL